MHTSRLRLRPCSFPRSALLPSQHTTRARPFSGIRSLPPHPVRASPFIPPVGWTPTPYVTETIGGGHITSDIFSRLLTSRIILLSGPIDTPVSASLVAQLLFLESTDPTAPISLYINSPGGSVTDGLAVYDTMTYIASPVATICIGQAASMGSLLLCGGERGQRYALKHSSVMVHQPSGGYQGQASDIAIHAREILRVRGELNEIYRRHMRREGEEERDIAEVEELMERDTFMGAEEAVRRGIVDRVLTRRGEEREGVEKKDIKEETKS